MKQFFTLLALSATFFVSAQTVTTFENVPVPVDSFFNGSNGDESVTSGNVQLTYGYNFDFGCCASWGISSKTDTITSGFTNEFSAKTGSGYDGSSTYAVSSGGENTLQLIEPATVQGFYITNTTYAYNSMRDGDSFAKRFGGETGDDPDFFKLTIYPYFNGELGTDSVEFYLADYRFEDNSQDYIVNTWEWVDLSPLGTADSLLFRMSSSDVGEFGINTPLYFAMDNFTTDEVTSTQNVEGFELDVFPNPTTDKLVIRWEEHMEGQALLLDRTGRILSSQFLQQQVELDVSQLASGHYFLQVQTKKGSVVRKVVKN